MCTRLKKAKQTWWSCCWQQGHGLVCVPPCAIVVSTMPPNTSAGTQRARTTYSYFRTCILFFVCVLFMFVLVCMCVCVCDGGGGGEGWGKEGRKGEGGRGTDTQLRTNDLTSKDNPSFPAETYVKVEAKSSASGVMKTRTSPASKTPTVRHSEAKSSESCALKSASESSRTRWSITTKSKSWKSLPVIA